jgi:hypothetical protein
MGISRILPVWVLAALAVSPIHATAAETRGDVCTALSSAFAAGFDTGGKTDGSWPSQVRPSRVNGPDNFSLTTGLDASLRETSLTASEIADLKRNAEKHVFAPYGPDCHGRGALADVVEGDQVMTAEFLRPLFSSDGRIAVVVWSLQSTGRWGHGHFCVVRKAGSKWRGSCRDTWIG